MKSLNFKPKDIGQFVMTGIAGHGLSDEEKDFIKSKNIGGVILFAHNYDGPEQLARLINSIQELRGDYPLFIGVDQEGGRVRRFKTDFKQFPPMGDIGLLGDTQLCFEAHRIMAEELRGVGVNLSFSPVCDVLTNKKNKVIGDRAFSDDANEVALYATWAIKGLAAGNVISVAKHFPGHGDTEKDSHFDLPVVEKSIEQMEKCEFIPFYKAVEAKVDMALMAHLQADALDKDCITTVSLAAYGLLREKVGFKGVIISDDMEMKAVANIYGTQEGATRALLAGCDIVVYRSMARAREAFDGLSKAIGEGRIDEGKLYGKISEIYALKEKKLLPYHSIDIAAAAKALGLLANEQFYYELMRKIAEQKGQKQGKRP